MSDSYPQIYRQSLALLTDFYQVTMSYGYWKAGLDRKEAVFHLFFRKLPFSGGFTVAAGLEHVIHYLENFAFEASDLAYLAQLVGPDGIPYFSQDFLDYLGQLKFTGHIDAVPEGTVVFPYEPLLRVQGPLIECQLLESPLLNLVNFPTLIATKAARMCLATKGEPIMEFGLRRAQGIDGALTASRAAYIGGCESTSNVLAGKLFGIPVKGTMSHSWVMVFDDELQAFQTYAENLPNNCVFLVDTYDTIEGVKKAIEVGKWLRQRGKRMLGIRLDSGDLADLSITSRTLLDQAGFKDAAIVASNELDETVISELKRQGAQINVWGVGTNLVTAKGQPALDGVYKLSAIRDPGEEWKYKLKLSEQMLKISNPGILQVKRFHINHENVADVIYDISMLPVGDWQIVDPLDSTHVRMIKKRVESKDLLEPIFRQGKCVYRLPTLQEIRDYTQQELAGFPVGIKRFLNPHLYVVGMEKSLYDLKINLIKQIRQLSSILPNKGSPMRALLLVDLQNDFMPGGALAVPRGDEIIPLVNELIHYPFDLIIATKDWHPSDHCSFASYHGKRPGEHVQLAGIDQILWPVHCVQGTWGAEFAPGWDTTAIDKVIYKGTESLIDSYSTFFDNEHLKSTGLENYLREKGVRDLFIAGLTTDYCVKYSTFDALQLGFHLYVIVDACRAVNLNPEDSEKALDLMRKGGATLLSFKDVKDLIMAEDRGHSV